MERSGDEVSERGYAVLPAFAPDASGEEAVRRLGEALQLGEGPAVHRIVPTERDATTPNTYSGLYGLDAFPFHTDMAHWRDPPRYLLLRCLVGFEEVPTLLVDGRQIIDEAGQGVLARALVQPRRRVRGEMPLLRLHQPGDGVALLRWDEVFIKPASPAGEIGVARFREALRDAPRTEVPLCEPGDTLVIDNWRMLHARSSVPTRCAGRILERAYLGRLH